MTWTGLVRGLTADELDELVAVALTEQSHRHQLDDARWDARPPIPDRVPTLWPA